MNKYGKAAIKAVEIYRLNKLNSPRDAWRKATTQIFGMGSSSQDKSCPRDSFLGLCEEGMVRGIPAGNYTRSKKNKAYAMKAVLLLRRNPALRHNTSILWEEVAPKGKTPNYQTEVVVALWDNNLILR